MKKYQDIENNSDIESYDYDENSFRIWFKNGDEHDYTKSTIGFYELNNLKTFANLGKGLDEYLKKLETKE